MPLKIKEELPKAIYSVLRKDGPATARMIQDRLSKDERRNVRQSSVQRIAGVLKNHPELFYQSGFDGHNRVVWNILVSKTRCLYRKKLAVQILKTTENELVLADLDNMDKMEILEIVNIVIGRLVDAQNNLRCIE